MFFLWKNWTPIFRNARMNERRLAVFRRVVLLISFLCITALGLGMSDRQPPSLWQILLVPGVIGQMLIGGAHGGASEGALKIAGSIANGLFWAGLIQCVLFAIGESVSRKARQKNE
jgi:hypothetical protein